MIRRYPHIAQIALVLAPVLVAPALAAEPERLTPQHVARIRTVTNVAASPDGRRVAYVLSVPRRPVADDDGPAWAELHVVGRDGPSHPFVAGEVNVGDVAWTRDGQSIAFLAKRGKDEYRSLYVIPADGGEARRVVAHGADLAGFALGPGGRAAFLAAEPEPKAKADLKKKGFNQSVYEEDYRPIKVWLARLDNPEATAKPLDLPGSASELRWSPTGTRLAVALAPTPSVDDQYMRRKVHILDADTGKVVGRLDHAGKLAKVAWSPDGTHLALIAGADIHDPAPGRLFVAPSEGGPVRDVLSDYQGHVADVAWRGADSLVFIGDEGTRTVLGAIGRDGTRRQNLAGGDTIWTALSLASDARAVALVGQSPGHPGEVFLADLGETPRRRTDSNPWLSKVELAPQEVVRYKARDGLDLEGILIRSLAVAKGARAPLVLDVHGGPESHVRNGWVTSYAGPGQVLAARGISVFLPNYRGSTGRGVTFSKLGQGDPAGKEFDDLVDAVDHLVEAGVADRSKVGVTGGSYGGYATAWCSTRYSDRFAAGVMFVGISDKISKTGTTDIPEEEYLVHARHRPWDAWQKLLERSPIYHVQNARTPLLILHGKDDPRVFPGQSLELYRFLKVQGRAPVRLVLYPGEGHGNQRAASRYDYQLRSLAWLEHYLKGPGGPPPPVELNYEQSKPDAPSKP
jgi:dipeptidyl aminopeptidase/acylaminoacyl peptidase